MNPVHVHIEGSTRACAMRSRRESCGSHVPCHSSSHSLSGEMRRDLLITCGSLRNNVRRQMRSWRLTIPPQRNEIIADDLLVVTVLRCARLIHIRSPEARGVGREGFINQQDLPLAQAKFKFGVGQEETFGLGKRMSCTIQRETEITYLGRETGEPTSRSTSEKGIFSSCAPASAFVEGVNIGSGSRSLSRKPFRQLNAAHRATRAILLPAGTGKIATDDAFNWERLCLFHQHRPSA